MLIKYIKICLRSQEKVNEIDKRININFESPSWVIEDVTDDIRYKNGYLARYGIPENN